MEPRVFAFGITVTSSQCTFHIMEAISVSSLNRLESKGYSVIVTNYPREGIGEESARRIEKKVYAIYLTCA